MTRDATWALEVATAVHLNLAETLVKGGWKHEHDGWQLHPIQVKDHQAYFSEHPGASETQEEARRRHKREAMTRWRSRQVQLPDNPEGSSQEQEDATETSVQEPSTGRAGEVMRDTRANLEREQDRWFAQRMEEPEWDRIEKACQEHYGFGMDEYMRRVEDHLRDEFKECRVWTQMRGNGLEAFLRQGAARNVFEGGRSAARANYPGKNQEYMDERQRVERLMFGDSHPLYGYIARSRDGGLDDMSPYGGYALRLRDDVRADTTFTESDSLNVNMGQRRYVKDIPKLGIRKGQLIDTVQEVPSPMESPSWRSIFPLSNDIGKPRWDHLNRHIQQGGGERSEKPYPLSPYEAQIHRQVTTDDVEEVVCYKEPSERIKALLEKRGIPYRVVADKGYNAWEENPDVRRR